MADGKSEAGHMIHLINELKVLPGIIGACLFDAHAGVKVSNLPSIFKPDRLGLIGRHLLKIRAAGAASFEDLTDVSLHYDESVIVARMIDPVTLIFVICDPTFNQSLLTMSLNLLQEEYLHPAPAHNGDPVVETVVARMPAALLDQIKKELASILGPVAGFIADEVFEQWQVDGDDLTRSELLIEGIAAEAGSSQKAEACRQRLSRLISAFQEGQGHGNS